jgi:hypothetical protein
MFKVGLEGKIPCYQENIQEFPKNYLPSKILMTDTHAISETCADIPYVTEQEIASLANTEIQPGSK